MSLTFGKRFLNKKLTLKQYKFVKNYLSCGLNATRAVLLSGYNVSSYGSAKSIGYENLAKLHLREAILEELHTQGITYDYLTKALNSVICSGIGISASNSDSIKGLELIERLRNNF